MKLKIKVFIKKEKQVEDVDIVNFKKRTVKLNEGFFNGSYKFNDVLFLHYTGLPKTAVKPLPLGIGI